MSSGCTHGSYVSSLVPSAPLHLSSSASAIARKIKASVSSFSSQVFIIAQLTTSLSPIVITSATMQESSGQSGSVLKEHDYIGLSEASSASATMNDSREDVECPLEDTDLRLELGLGLGIGSGFQDRLVKHFFKEAEGEAKVAQVTKSQSESTYPSSMSEFPRGLAPPTLKNGVKRVYSEAMATAPKHQQQSSFLSNWAPSKPTVPSWCAVGFEQPAHTYAPSNSAVMAGALKDSPENSQEPATADNPPSKGQVVGWPPVRSYRRQALAKPAETFVKVNMDGITVGRKVDLNAYTSYESLLLALEEMFQPSNAAQAAPQVPSGRENDLKHFLLASGSDFVLTYEDKDGDWMLVGDVPWSMFISTVRRLRITRGSEANGPAQRRPEKSRYHV